MKLSNRISHRARLAALVFVTAAGVVLFRAPDADRSKPATPGALPQLSRAQAATPGGKGQIARALLGLPLSFEANEGQTAAPVKFLSRGPGYTMFLTSDEAVIALRRTLPPDSGQMGRASLGVGRLTRRALDRVVRLKLVNANPNAQVSGLDPLGAQSNYLIGNDPQKWHKAVTNYSKVRYAAIYPGVDLIFYGNQRQLEYDFVVGPGADPKSIVLNLDGAEKAAIDPQGDLVLEAGEGSLRLHKPFAYQETDGVRNEVPCSFVLAADNHIRFQVADYDSSRPLILDPVLSYSTYLGGSAQDISVRMINVDSSGAIYVAGYTLSTDFPTTAGAYKNVTSGKNDVFVAKLDPSQSGASSLVASTYLGGSQDDVAYGMTIDDSGDVYVTGYTLSDNFPVTPNAYQPARAASASYCGPAPGCTDAFVAKLNISPSGAVTLLYSTFIGAECSEDADEIALDSTGRLYIFGGTCSLAFPTTANAFSRSRCGPNDDAFWVMDISLPPSQQLLYSAVFGGCGSEFTGGIALDAANNAYLAGYTYNSSSGFPTTAGAFQRTSASYPASVFVMKVNPSLSGAASLIYSTFVDGTGNDGPQGIAVDASGNAYIAGLTNSANFPTTSNAYQRIWAGGYDAFVSVLNPSGSGLLYSSFLGGSTGDDAALALRLDASGHVWITGYSKSNNFPTTPGAFQTAFGGVSDAFIAELDTTQSGAASLLYSSYLGGSGDDEGYGLTLDRLGNAYVVGITKSIDFPTTANAYDSTCGTDGRCNGSFYDAFITKLALAPNSPPMANAGSNQTVEATSSAGANVTLDGSGSSDLDHDTLTYTWTGPFGTTTGVNPVVVMPLGTNTVNLTVDDGHSNTATASVMITVQDTTPPSTMITSHPNSVTNNNSASFAFSGNDLVTPSASLTFQCSLDNAAYSPCASPQTYASLADGVHSFSVRAIDAAHNTDPTGAMFMWTVDTVPPVLTLPADITTQASSPAGAVVSFSATANDAVAGAVAVTCNPPSGSTFPIGMTTVNCSASDTAGNTAMGSFHVTVTRISQTISFTTLPNHTYGDADFGVSASSSSGLAVSFTAGATDNCTISSNMVHITGAGSCTVTAHQAGNATYLAAADVSQPFSISKAPASVTPYAAGKTYGTSDPAFSGTLTGFLPADNVTATYSRTAGEMVAGSPYTISATLSPAGVLGNYNITYTTASFSITPAHASVTPNPASKTYGTADPAFTGTLSGFVAADNVTAIYSRTAGEMVTGGPYTISAALSPSGVLGNYSITYNTAAFSITQANASVTPNPASKSYGTTDPVFTGTLSGFLPADGVTATYSRTPGESVVGSPYTVSATLGPAAVLANYSITYGTAPFTITAAALVATASNANRIYGDPNPVFTGALTGVASGDGITVSFSSPAVQGSPVGNYAIVPTLTDPLGKLVNYSVTLNNGTLAIQPAPLAIMANSYARPYGANNPVLMGTITGLKNGDPITANFVTSASPASPVGGYTIVSMAVDTMNLLGNYAVSLVNGTLTVNIEPTTLSVMLTPASIHVGQSTQVTVTLTAPDMVIPIPAGVLTQFTATSPVLSDIITNNGVCTPTPSATPGVASCVFTLSVVEPNGRTIIGNFAGTSALGASLGKADLTVSAALVTQQTCIKSDFRNVAVAANSSVWLNSILRAHVDEGLTQKMTITFYQSSVQFQYTNSANQVVTINQAMPDAKITVDPSVTTPTTTFDAVNNVWITTLPYDTDDNAFLTGMPWLVPAGGLPADVEPVTWCGTFASDTANVDLSWRWTAAAYSSFSADNNALGVKPMDSDGDNWAPNHDKAGTPENFRQFVIAGARGKGGKNYTGTYSKDADIE